MSSVVPETYKKVILTPMKMTTIQKPNKKQKKKGGKDVGKFESLFITGGNVKSYSHERKYGHLFHQFQLEYSPDIWK